MTLKCYAKFLASHPYVVILTVSSLSLVCLTVSIWTEKLPNFSDPQLGFETRGTGISCRLTTWENLLKATTPSGPLLANPGGDQRYKVTTTLAPVSGINEIISNDDKYSPTPRTASLKTGRRKKKPLKSWNDYLLADSEIGRISAWVPENNASQKLGATDRLVETLEREEWASLKQSDVSHDQKSLDDIDNDDTLDDNDHSQHDLEHHDHDHLHLSADGFFCEGLSASYSHLVLTPKDPSQSLFNLQTIQCMCKLEINLMSVKEMQGLCQTIEGDRCCPAWSLPNYIAMLNNKTSCSQLTEMDVSTTRSLLAECFTFFTSEKLEPLCDVNKKCKGVPSRCRQFDAVYNLFQYILDRDFEPNRSFTPAAMVFLPIARSSAVLPYLLSLTPSQMTTEMVAVSALDFGVKGALFDEYLVRDAILMAGAALFIFLCLWSYTGSFFLTMCSIAAVTMSLFIAFFLYTFLFAIQFFPFMNLLGVVVAIGTGTDDAFIYCKLWDCVKNENGGASIESLVASTLRSSAVSMVVTSLTTAAALFSNCVSPITAINCFSIFAGTAVLVNFFLMVSWLPACIVISENWCLPPLVPLQWRPALNVKIRLAKEHTSQVKVLLDRCLMLGVLRLRWLWVPLLGSVACAAVVVVLHYPKLRLPDSKTFQLFESRHPVEQYDLTYRNKFLFEHQGKGDPWDDAYGKLPLRFVWGVLPTDNGNYLDPASRGTLQFDPRFDITAQESQTWLLRFCRDLRYQPFYKSTMGPLLSNCFIETFKSWMSRRCKDSVRNQDVSPCCESSPFPFSRRVFSRCLPEAVASAYETPNLFEPGFAGPRFLKGKRHEVKAIVIEYDSNWTLTSSFHDMTEFFKTVDGWFQTQLASAPPGLKNGWFVSDLGFYDLQMALSDGTVAAIALSLGVALIVVFLTTLNALISIFTVLTISAIIFVTVATLVLLGWKLNILESVAVTTAIGLSVDFCLHYGVHYRLSGEELRQPSAVHSLTRMSGPTAMGALTTGAAGFFMLPSAVLPYIQIGILLVVLTTVSWVYSTVFLMSLLAIAGPERGCGQFSRPSPRDWCRAQQADKPVTPGLWSESTLSTSSGPAEVHELEALTRAPRRNRRPRAQSPAAPDDVDADSITHVPS